jgi:hypothetical protein
MRAASETNVMNLRERDAIRTRRLAELHISFRDEMGGEQARLPQARDRTVLGAAFLWGNYMGSLARHFWPCLKVIIDSVNKREKITYGQLANNLGLKLAKQEWDTVLHLIAGKMKRELGDDYDLTWNVVYATGPAKDLGRYFSNGKKAPGSTLLDPRDREQVADYERKLKEIYQYTYKLQRIDDKDQVTKVPR